MIASHYANPWGGDYASTDEDYGQFSMMGIGAITAPLFYVPNLAAVGSEGAGTYYPGDVSQDAIALAFLGFLAESELAAIGMTRGSRAADMPAQVAGFAPRFKQAVGAFQGSAAGQAGGAGVVDTRIGPNTRKALATAVAAENARRLAGGLPPPPPPPAPGPLVVPPPGVLPAPVTPPGVTPASTKDKDDDTLTYVAVGGGVLALAAIAYFALR